MHLVAVGKLEQQTCRVELRNACYKLCLKSIFTEAKFRLQSILIPNILLLTLTFHDTTSVFSS